MPVADLCQLCEHLPARFGGLCGQCHEHAMSKWRNADAVIEALPELQARHGGWLRWMVRFCADDEPDGATLVDERGRDWTPGCGEALWVMLIGGQTFDTDSETRFRPYLAPDLDPVEWPS